MAYLKLEISSEKLSIFFISSFVVLSWYNVFYFNIERMNETLGCEEDAFGCEEIGYTETIQERALPSLVCSRLAAVS